MTDMFKKHINCELIERILDSKAMFVLMAAGGFACFYYYLINAGIMAHDELYALSAVHQGNYFDVSIQNYLNTPRGLFIVDVFLQYPQYLCTTEWAYRLFDVAAIAACLYFGYRLIRELFDEKLARYFVLAFLMCTSFSDADHNGFVCFGWTYKIRLFLVFFLLELIVLHFKTSRHRYWVISILLYVLASALYEALVLACVPIAGIVLYELKKLDRFQPKEIGKYAVSFALPVCCYLLLYAYISMNTAPEYQYAGASLTSSITAQAFLESVWIYSVGATPFVRTAGGLIEFLTLTFAFSPKTLLFWLKAIAFAALAIRYMRQSEINAFDGLIVGSIFLLTALALCIPFGLSAQYVQWATETNGDVRGYGISYYSLYFWVATFVCWSSALSNFVKDKLPNLSAQLIAILFAFLVLVSLHSDYNIRAYSGSLDWLDDRYELFDSLAASDEFARVPENSVIYCPEYIGIFFRMDTLSQYASAYTGKRYRFENNASMIDGLPDYYLYLDTRASLLLFADCTDTDAYSAVTAFSLSPFESGSLLMNQVDGQTIFIELNGINQTQSDDGYTIEYSNNNNTVSIEAELISHAVFSHSSQASELSNIVYAMSHSDKAELPTLAQITTGQG